MKFIKIVALIIITITILSGVSSCSKKFEELSATLTGPKLLLRNWCLKEYWPT